MERSTSRNFVITVFQLICRDIGHKHVSRSVADIDRYARCFKRFLRRDSARSEKRDLFVCHTYTFAPVWRFDVGDPKLCGIPHMDRRPMNLRKLVGDLNRGDRLLWWKWAHGYDQVPTEWSYRRVFNVREE